MGKLLIPKIIFIVSTAVLCHSSPLRAQDSRPPEPNAAFIPQAQPGQARKPAAPARRAAPQPTSQNRVQTSAAPGARVGALPNGASQLSETYGDWTLTCSMGTKVCTLSQALVNKEGQRAFLIELRVAKDGASEGTILMPFGLKLDAGVLLKLDDRDMGQGLRFSTCVAQGCMLPHQLSGRRHECDPQRQGACGRRTEYERRSTGYVQYLP